MVRLDTEKLKSRNTTVVCLSDALADVEPIVWSDAVMNGTKQVTISSVASDKEVKVCGK